MTSKNERDLTPEERDRFQLSSPRIVVCYTTCWACKFNQHSQTWHPWADQEDIDHAAKMGRVDPSDQQCGCYCQRKTKAREVTQ